MLENIQSIIFDLDGTLIDTIPIWEETHEKVLSHYKITTDVPQFLIDIQGLSTFDCSKLIVSKFNTEHSPEAINATYIEIYISLFANFQFISGAKNFILALQKRNFPFGIASACPRKIINILIEKHQFLADVVFVTCDDVGKSKPDPAVYLECMRQIGAESVNSIVFEDTIAGMQGGKAAGAKVIGVLSEKSNVEVKRGICDFLIDDYLEIIKEVE